MPISDDLAALADIIRRQRDKIPAEIARLQEQEQHLTEWLAEFAPDAPMSDPDLPTAPVVGHDPVTNVPLCEHGDDAAACQLAHRNPDQQAPKELAGGYVCDGCGDQADHWDEDAAPRCQRCSDLYFPQGGADRD